MRKNKTSGALPEAEWAFHKVPQCELRYCAEWELSRLCGRKQQPWLKLTDAAKQRFVFQEQGSFQEVPIDIGHSLKRCLKKSAPAVQVITFIVDFRENESALLEIFRFWFKSSPHRKKCQKKSATLNGRWRSLLAKIVVLRATEAGFSRAAAKEKTLALWKKWQLNDATSGILSAPHWSRALREAKALRKPLPARNPMIIGNPPYGLQAS